MAKKPKAKSARKRLARKQSTDAVEAALAALAHDIRTPLNGILALTELLAASELGARERGWAAAAKNAAEHLARYTTVVTDAVRAGVVGLAVRQDVFSPRHLVEAIGASLAARAATNGLTSKVAIAGKLPDRVTSDPVRLRAALENLIDNAVKFTARGGITLNVSAKRAVRGRTMLIFVVGDSGIGLKPAEIKKLFRPFAQANAGVAERYGGAGLGLVLVRRLARAMGGDLTVTSKPGKGSTFRLSVLVAPAKDQSDGKQNASVPKSPPPASLKILCVEDNPYGRVVMNTMLSQFGHRVDFVGSGEAGVEAVGRGGYDVVLMDMTLPGISGVAAARRIRGLAQAVARVPIIAVSGRSGGAEEEAARDAGIDIYLQKPVTPASLSDAIRRIATR
jgi:CheY-like chemotaxis protein/nitrogen-specific signal transduction histidine kinase